MAEPVLLLWLEAPLQSWGIRSRWDVRDTGLEPTKSGVIGLLGCAMGLGRNDPRLEGLDRDLLFGVRADRTGLVSTDYHTVSGYHRTAAGDLKHRDGTATSLSTALEHEENTVVSPRDYLHDAAFLVALTSRDPALLRQLAGEEAHPAWPGDLQQPKWPLYLGRKACVPSRPIFRRLANEYEGVENALRSEPWSGPRLQAGQPRLLEAWIESDDGPYERQDALRLNQLRFYDFRRCKRIEVETALLPRRAT